MAEGFTLQKAAVLAAIVVIVGIITMGSGYIAKMMTRANACHQTKMMLFLAGLITALIIAGLGAILMKYTDEAERKKWTDKIWAEQFRYGNDLADLAKKLERNEQFRYGPEAALQAAANMPVKPSEYFYYADDIRGKQF